MSLKAVAKFVRSQPIYIVKTLAKRMAPKIWSTQSPFIFWCAPLKIKWSSRAFPDLLTRHLLFSGFYQEDVLLAIKHLVERGHVVYDIGAHHGLMTVIASKCLGSTGKVISFEPNPFARIFLEENLAFNDVTNVSIQPIGLLDKKGFFDFYPQSGDVSWNSSFIREFVDTKKKSKPVKVKVQTLDDFVKHSKFKPHLIKIDVEGAEFLILKGANETIREFKPILIMEFNEESAEKAGTSIHDIIGELKAQTYDLFVLDKGFWWFLLGRYNYSALRHYDPKRDRQGLFNVICIPKKIAEDKVRKRK